MNSCHILDFVAGGWSVDSLLIVRSGLPVDISLSRASSALSDGNNQSQRPDYVPGQSVYGGRGIHTWLNPNAFSVPASGTWGNLHRDAAVGPTLWQDDAAIEKSLPIPERNTVTFPPQRFTLF